MEKQIAKLQKQSSSLGISCDNCTHYFNIISQNKLNWRTEDTGTVKSWRSIGFPKEEKKNFQEMWDITDVNITQNMKIILIQTDQLGNIAATISVGTLSVTNNLKKPEQTTSGSTKTS